ncbi:MAG: hypothetical protein WC732_10025 [Candidatus Omnitrophota bacterium]
MLYSYLAVSNGILAVAFIAVAIIFRGARKNRTRRMPLYVLGTAIINLIVWAIVWLCYHEEIGLAVGYIFLAILGFTVGVFILLGLALLCLWGFIWLTNLLFGKF